MGVQIHEDRYGVVSVSLTPVSTAATTSAEQTFTVQGLTTDMYVGVNQPSATAYLGVGGVRVSAANTLAITFQNQSSAGLTSASGIHKVFWFKPEIVGVTAVQPG